MAKATKFQFVLKSEADKTKPALLYVMFSLDRRYKISLQESVLPQWWDKETQRAIVIESGQQKQVDTRNAKRVNRFLNYAQPRFEEIFEAHKEWRRVKTAVIAIPYPAQIARIIRGVIMEYHKKEVEEIKKQNQTPTQYFEEYIAKLPTHTIRRTGTVMKPQTISNHRIVLNRFKRFLHHYGMVDSFQIFNKYFEEKMEAFLLLECGYTPNTVCATNSIMKVWLKQAEEDGLIKDKSFHSWKSKGYNVKHIYLTDEEIGRLYALDFTDEFKAQNKIDLKSSIEQTRDLFIIGCKTGLRISDLHLLNASQWDLELRTLTVNTQKTQKRVVIPLSDEVISIYKKYDGKFPSPVYKSAFNRQIQRCAMIAGINDTIYINVTKGGKVEQEATPKWKLVSSHTARRSFATNLYKKSHNSLMVMKFTGHTTEENFLKYICIDDEEMVELAREFF